jgi:hypothetical protein
MNMLQEQYRSQQAEQAALAERRNALRVPVIKSGKILVGGAYSQGVLNCLVLDESAAGVLVDLGAVFSLPEEVVLQLGNGASYRARRRWAVGTKAGLEFLGPQAADSDIEVQMTQMAQLLATKGLSAAMAGLRAQHYFSQPELKLAAEDAEAAYHRLEAILTAGRPI